MEPNEPQFGVPRNNFEEVWGAAFGFTGNSAGSLERMQRHEHAKKVAEQKETDEKFNEIIKNNKLDEDK